MLQTPIISALAPSSLLLATTELRNYQQTWPLIMMLLHCKRNWLTHWATPTPLPGHGWITITRWQDFLRHRSCAWGKGFSSARFFVNNNYRWYSTIFTQLSFTIDINKFHKKTKTVNFYPERGIGKSARVVLKVSWCYHISLAYHCHYDCRGNPKGFSRDYCAGKICELIRKGFGD